MYYNFFWHGLNSRFYSIHGQNSCLLLNLWTNFAIFGDSLLNFAFFGVPLLKRAPFKSFFVEIRVFFLLLKTAFFLETLSLNSHFSCNILTKFEFVLDILRRNSRFFWGRLTIFCIFPQPFGEIHVFSIIIWRNLRFFFSSPNDWLNWFSSLKLHDFWDPNFRTENFF